MKHQELRSKYLNFFRDRAHSVIENAPLVLQGDATTLFTSSGMQPLVPYLSGKETHPKGKRLVNVQQCIRLGDIEEVGDDRHTTFFEMLGNWSLGDYYKEDQLTWMWVFFTEIAGLDPDRLYITVFAGNDEVEKDTETAEIWKKIGVPEDHIYYYGVKDNWWSRSGPPENMPAGEIGGPSTEVFFDFGSGPHSGPDSDEKRFIELGNSVFIQYEKLEDGSLKELPQKNVDFGGGIERIYGAVCNAPDLFTTDLFTPIIEQVEAITGRKYDEEKEAMQIIADHMRASAFLIRDGVIPSSKEHGYILRRLLRRAAVKLYGLKEGTSGILELSKLAQPVVEIFTGVYFKGDETEMIQKVIHAEMKRFSKTLERGLKKINKLDEEDLNKEAFNLYQSFGFPFELTEELAHKNGITLDVEHFKKAQKEHQKLSRSASAGKFKGGLADTSDQVIKYHTATHLLHKALKDVFGDAIRQEGSNITQERLRFDVKLDRKPTDDELKQIENIINAKVDEKLPVYKVVMSKEKADTLGAASFFREKYGKEVSVYFIGGSENDLDSAYSKEFCGGPHVSNTKEIGHISLFKVKKIGSNLVRFYARSQ